MIQRFLDQNEPVKKTLAMEYSFGRKSGRSLSKDICHVWELAGGVVFVNLLNVYLGNFFYSLTIKINLNIFPSKFNLKNEYVSGRSKNSTLVLVIDLSSPETLWNVLETIIQTSHSILKKKEIAGEFEPNRNKIDQNHEDFEYISPFPVPLIIVGGKYDLFEEIEPDKRKVICRTLRQVAHSLAASLIFYSDKDPGLVKKLKDVFHHHGFGGSQW